MARVVAGNRFWIRKIELVVILVGLRHTPHRNRGARLVRIRARNCCALLIVGLRGLLKWTFCLALRECALRFFLGNSSVEVLQVVLVVNLFIDNFFDPRIVLAEVDAFFLDLLQHELNHLRVDVLSLLALFFDRFLILKLHRIGGAFFGQEMIFIQQVTELCHVNLVFQRERFAGIRRCLCVHAVAQLIGLLLQALLLVKEMAHLVKVLLVSADPLVHEFRLVLHQLHQILFGLLKCHQFLQ